MKRVRDYKLYLIVFVCLLCSGCWDKVELENRGFIISLGIDKYDNGRQPNQTMEGVNERNRYTVSAVLPNVMDIKESAVSDKSKEVKTADSSTVWGCIQLMDAASSQKLYLGQAKLMVLGKDMLSDEVLLRQTLDAMERNRDISQKLYLLSTKERAESILRMQIPGEPMLGLFMVNYYKNNDGTGSFNFHKVLEKIIHDLSSTGCTLIPEIERRAGTEQDEDDNDNDAKDDDGIDAEKEGEKNNENEKGGGRGKKEKSDLIMLGGCAVIKDYKLAGWLNDMETRGYAWVMGNCRDTEITASYENGYIPLKVNSSKSSIKFSQQDGKLVCSINVKVSGIVHEHDFGAADLYKPDNQIIEAAFEQAVSNEILQTAARIQTEMGADVYNFKDLLRKKNHKLYLACSEDWERYFREMEIIPEVKVDIISIGIIK